MNTLRSFSVAYLLVPNLIFVLGWFRGTFSIPIVLCLCCLIFRQIRFAEKNESYHISAADLLILLAAASFWTFCTGMGGLSYQIADYWIHNAKFYDLYKNPWPTYFPEKGKYACYYFGYFMVPAAISKLLGHLSIGALLLWSVLGLWLSVAWLYILLRKQKSLILLFLFLGGTGHLAKVLFYQVFTQYSFHIATFYSEIWALYDQSLWVTNQIIPIILVCSIIVYDAFVRDRFEESFFPVTLTFLWAIFPSIIFVVLLAILFIGKYHSNVKAFFTPQKLVPLIFAGLAFLPTFIFLRASESVPINGFIWQFEPVNEILAEYAVGVLLDLILLFLIVRELRQADQLVPGWFVNAVFVLFLIMSLYRIGHWNDWFVRGYNPLLFIILLTIVRSLYLLFEQKQWKRTVYFNTLIILLGLSLFIPVGHILRSLRTNVFVSAAFPKTVPFKPIPYDNFPNTYQALLVHTASKEREANQYLGKEDSFYAKYLSRKSGLAAP